MEKIYEKSELIINPDGSIFHLHLRPEEVGTNIILVGDPQRVDLVANYFENVLFTAKNREFYSKTGPYGGKLFTVLSTGIGTDNIDIVLNEIDAVINIDFESRTNKTKFTKLKFVRIGTSGALHQDLIPGRVVLSQYAIGFDGLLNFYKDRNQVCDLELEKEFVRVCNWSSSLPDPYSVKASEDLAMKFPANYTRGITLSANGFYGPQLRALRATPAFGQLVELFPFLNYHGLSITNFEMECSALYGLSRLLGHEAVTVCGIIANRLSKKFLGDYNPLMESIIISTLDILSQQS